MKRLGAAPVAMPQSDVPDALQKGVVKGNVSSGEVLKDMNYAAYCPYVFKTDLCVTSFAVVMNKAKYDALPADVKQTLDALYREQADWTGAYVDGHVQEALAWAKENPQADGQRALAGRPRRAARHGPAADRGVRRAGHRQGR
jgi:TRAP-type transport system periplasmic protein